MGRISLAPDEFQGLYRTLDGGNAGVKRESVHDFSGCVSLMRYAEIKGYILLALAGIIGISPALRQISDSVVRLETPIFIASLGLALEGVGFLSYRNDIAKRAMKFIEPDK